MFTFFVPFDFLNFDLYRKVLRHKGTALQKWLLISCYVSLFFIIRIKNQSLHWCDKYIFFSLQQIKSKISKTRQLKIETCSEPAISEENMNIWKRWCFHASWGMATEVVNFLPSEIARLVLGNSMFFNTLAVLCKAQCMVCF